jgi:peptide/nickel transport system substrate-binding protein
MNIFNTPLYRDADLNFVPGLVEEWSVDESSTVWTLKLREGVTFHDGTPFNAEALKFNFDRISNPETASKKAAGLLMNPTTTVVDEYTVEVAYEEPYGAFLDALSTPVMGIVSPASVEEFGADVGRNPVGTGPFKFVEWIAQDRIVLERNPDYDWAPSTMTHQGPVGFEQLIFRVIPEDVSRVVALETGEIDALINLPREQVARFEGDAAFGVERAVVAGSPAMMVINGSKFPTDDLQVRQALEYGVNQDDLIAAALFGVGLRAYGPLSSANPCYDSSLEGKYSYDPAQASALLAEAGWADADGDGVLDKDGQPLAVEYITFGGAANRRTAEIIQAQLLEIGVDLTIREMESPAIQAARQAGEHNLAWLTWLGMDPAVMEVMLHSRNIGTGWNFSHYPMPELDALLDQGNREVDDAARCDIYRQAQNIVMDEAIIIPMYLQEQIVAYSSQIEGLGMSPHGDYIEWYNATTTE